MKSIYKLSLRLGGIWLLTWLCVFHVMAQSRTVSGKVTDPETGGGLPGVNIIIKGTKTGSISDLDGNFKVNIPDEKAVLVFSFIGFVPQEVPVGAQNMINIQLLPDVKALSEIVVIGFGTKEKKDLTGAISTVSAKDIETVPFASPQFALQGKTPGVRVMNMSGNPSEGPTIHIRGVSTWRTSAQPLYVIDGQIITPPDNMGNQDLIGNINLWTMINPADVESISVLKDASAAAIYGSRAANGVILITTKRGKRGLPKVEVNSQYGIQNIRTLDVLSTQQFIDLNREMYNNSENPNHNLLTNLYGRNEANPVRRLNEFSPQFDPESPFYLGNSNEFYDWQDAARRKNAANKDLSVKVSGASQSADYYLSVGMTEMESVLKGDRLTRYNVAMNVNTDIGKYIRTGLNYKITYQESEDGRTMSLQDAAIAPPWQPIYDQNNKYGFAPNRILYNESGAWEPRKLYGAGTRNNTLAFQELSFQDFNLLRNMAQGFIEIEPMKGLTVRGSMNLDYTYQQRESFNNINQVAFDWTRANPATSHPEGSYGNYSLRTNRWLNYQADLVANYNKTFGKHAISTMVGIQEQFHRGRNEDIGTQFVQSELRRRIVIGGGQANTNGFSGRNEKYWLSYISRAGYNFDRKYYLDLSFRRDASNGFPTDLRWGNFYSAAGAWRISSEEFMKNIPQINDLKLRGSYGQAGNDEEVVGKFAYLSNVSAMGSYSLGSGNGDPTGRYLIGSAVRGFPNRDFFWETVTTSNAGFDAVLFNNKINLTVEYFNRVTSDILQFVALPPTVGTASPVFNIGSVRNRGMEFVLGYNGKIGDFTYEVSGNMTLLNNKVLNLHDDAPLFLGGDRRVEVGRSIGHIWGYKLGGIFKTQQEIDEYFAKNPDQTIAGTRQFVRPGDMYFLDVHGNPTDEEKFYSKTPDGIINDFDRTEIGNTIPGHTYGVNLSGGWKGFDLNFNFYGEGDVDKINNLRRNMENVSGPSTNKMTSVMNRWSPANPNATIPRAIAGDPAGNNRLSDRWVEGAGFFRLNAWQLGYTLPPSILSKTNEVVNKFRIYIGGQNNLLLTRWQGLDPVNDVYPLPRSFFVGLNATF
jgi:TonB-dependent starch-binding outer membrane protein SusC